MNPFPFRRPAPPCPASSSRCRAAAQRSEMSLRCSFSGHFQIIYNSGAITSAAAVAVAHYRAVWPRPAPQVDVDADVSVG